jgi:hypothetical protein
MESLPPDCISLNSRACDTSDRVVESDMRQSRVAISMK